MSLNFNASNDEEFFGSLESNKRSSNLEEVFGIESTTKNKDNTTLKYQPSKQLTSTTNPDETKQTWNTLWAKVANAYKNTLVVGKVGVALLKNLDDNLGKIIVYKTKANVLATKTLTKDLPHCFKKSNYIQFYDDEHHYWSLNFNKIEDEIEFTNILNEIGFTIIPEEKSEIPETDVKSTDAIATNVSNVKIDEEIPPISAATQHSKSALLARMAKMGQQLPIITQKKQQTVAKGTDYSDSSDTEVIATPLLPKPRITPHNHNLHSTKNQIIATNTTALPLATVMESQLMQMLLSENRTQNSEMRMNMTKLETKIEKVLDKIDCLNMRAQQNPVKDDEIIELEEKLLILKKENRKLLQTLEHSETDKINKQLERQLISYESEFQELGISNTKDLDSIFKCLLKKIKTLEKQLKDSEALNFIKCKELQASVKNLNEQNMNVLARQSELQISITVLETAIQESKNYNLKLEQQLGAAKQENVNLSKLQKQDTLNTIKTIMNNLHSKLVNELDDFTNMETDQVLATIGKAIREETLKSIEKFNENK